MNKVTVYAFIVVLALFVFTPGAQALDAERRVLENGLTVIHVQRDNLPLVMATLLVKSGSADEPADRAGLASLTASLMGEGTEKRTSRQLSEDIDFIGASVSVSADRDYTTVTLSVLKKHAERGFELFSDVLLHPTFPKEEIERIKDLTTASLRRREEEPSFLASRAFIKAVYGGHPYGRLIRGTPETIERITRDDIAAFYSHHFLPNNSILSVVGDLSAGELDHLISVYLKGWKEGPVPDKKVPLPPPPALRVVRIDRDLTQANILLGHLGVERSHPDYYALSVMNYILGGGGFSSRLMDSVRDTMGLAYSIYSSFSAGKESGDFSVSVQTKNRSAPAVIEEVLRQMRAMTEEKVTGEELDDAKAFLIGSFPRRLDTMRKIADFLALVEFYGLGLDYPEKYRQHISRITREDVLEAARTHLHPDKYVLVVVAKQSEAGAAGNR